MNAKTTSSWWRGQAFTVVLLAIILVLTIWALLTASGAAAGTPALTAGRELALVVVGFLAGVLGGLIGTGGCSLMLPVIHFWMGYPAPIAVGTTLFAVIFTALSGAWGHLIRRNVDKRAFSWLVEASWADPGCDIPLAGHPHGV